MKKIFLLPLVLGGVLLTSCQDEDFGYESSKIAYEKTMTQMLGEVAADQTWVNAEQGCVTISEECKSVKVFDGLTGKMIARYSNLKAGDKVYYNATIGYNPTITNGAMAMEVTNGQTVSFASEGSTKSPITVQLGDIKKTLSIDFIDKDVLRYGEYGHVGNFNKPKDPEKEVSTNVEFMGGEADADGMASVRIYPLHWYTEDNLTFGLYYYDPITGERYEDNVIFNNHNNTTLESRYVAKGASIWEYVNAEGYTWDSRYHYPKLDNEQENNKYKELRTQAIEIRVPKNVVFGFYIDKIDETGATVNRYYSNPSLNEDKCLNNTDCIKCKHAGLFRTSTTYNRFVQGNDHKKYDSFSGNILGMNVGHGYGLGVYDIYFAIENVGAINYEAQSYTLCFEDLGATGIEDMDFNDCVLSLTCTNGENTAEVSLLAAGGRLPIEVSYNGKTVWDEIHAAFRKELVPVNANKHYSGVAKDVVSANPVSATIDLPEEANWTIQHVVSMFNLSVERADGTYNQVSIPTNPGLYPMGFAVAGEFKWPGEQQNIIGTYPDFATWAANSGYAYWYPWSAE